MRILLRWPLHWLMSSKSIRCRAMASCWSGDKNPIERRGVERRGDERRGVDVLFVPPLVRALVGARMMLCGSGSFVGTVVSFMRRASFRWASATFSCFSCSRRCILYQRCLVPQSVSFRLLFSRCIQSHKQPVLSQATNQ